jgi:hypothetical protein
MEVAESTPKAHTYSPAEGPYLAYYSKEDLQQTYKIIDDSWEPEEPKIFDCQEINNRMQKFCDEKYL